MTTALTPILRKADADTNTQISYGKVDKPDIGLRTLLTQKAQYFNLDPRQRSPIWQMHKRQKFIDTLLRPPEFMVLQQLRFNRVWNPEENRLYYTVEDGLQRLFTIYMFLNNNLRTFSREEYRRRIFLPEIDDALYGKLFSELPEETRQRFLEFNLPTIIAEGVSASILDEQYRRLNDGISLSKADKLRSYRGTVATELSELIATHPFLEVSMSRAKKKDRQYKSELALYLMFMKLHSFPVELHSNEIEMLAAGQSDYALTTQFQEELFLQLERIAHVFRGVRITAKTDGIPAWQASYYLQKAGCDFFSSEVGCLRPFFETTKKERLELVNAGNLSSYASMTHAYNQTQFWMKNKVRLLDQEGLVFPDRKQWSRERDGVPIVQTLEPSLTFDIGSGLVIVEGDRVTV